MSEAGQDTSCALSNVLENRQKRTMSKTDETSCSFDVEEEETEASLLTPEEAEKTVAKMKAVVSEQKRNSSENAQEESEAPTDIYKVVAEKTVAKMKTVLDSEKQHSAEIPNEEDSEVPTDAQMAAWWLEFGITRKECKRNTMTLV
jgi:hypothetical protein